MICKFFVCSLQTFSLIFFTGLFTTLEQALEQMTDFVPFKNLLFVLALVSRVLVSEVTQSKGRYETFAI